MGKVGLVLVGGALKGAYEAGVLKALAEQAIQPSVIVGVSAGALNGAFAAQAIAAGQFTAQTVEEGLITVWRDHATAQNFYDAPDSRKLTARERPSLSQIFNHLGIDPLRRKYRPRWSFDSLQAFEQLVKGEFASLISHGFLHQMLDASIQAPRRVVQPVTLSLVTTNLMGSIALTETGLSTDYSHYEEFHWADKGPGEWESMLRRLRMMVTASSSFPMVFPPVPLGLDGGVGLFADGGLVDCSPIGRAIHLDTEVDTILVVLGSTSVGSPSQRPENLLKILTRVFSILGGKFIIQNYQKVLKVNQRLAALRQVLQRGENGEVLRSPFNEQLCIAAGLKGMDDFLARREVRLVPIFPNPSLTGDLFDGFFDRNLRMEYIERGYHDGLAAISRESSVQTDLSLVESAFQQEITEIFSDSSKIWQR